MRRVRASHVVGFFLQGFGDTINRPSPQSVRPSPGGFGTRRPPKPIPPFFNTPFRRVQKSALYTVQVGSFASTHVFARYPDGGEAKKTITESS